MESGAVPTWGRGHGSEAPPGLKAGEGPSKICLSQAVEDKPIFGQKLRVVTSQNRSCKKNPSYFEKNHRRWSFGDGDGFLTMVL